MLALARKRRAPVAERIDPPTVEEMHDTPLTIALRELIALATREGIHVAAAKLTADPAMLQGLARAVLDADTATAQSLWLNAQDPVRTDNRYTGAMEAMGLAWCAFPQEFLQHVGRPNFPALRFRITYSYPHPSGAQLPAVVIPIFNLAGQLTACLLLFIKSDWSGWADVGPTSAVIGQTTASVIPLRIITRHTLMVGASFETVGKSKVGGEIPIWVTVTADNLAQHFIPPEDLRKLYILYDDHERPAACVAADRIARLHPHMSIALFHCDSQKVEEWPLD